MQCHELRLKLLSEADGGFQNLRRRPIMLQRSVTAPLGQLPLRDRQRLRFYTLPVWKELKSKAKSRPDCCQDPSTTPMPFGVVSAQQCQGIKTRLQKAKLYALGSPELKHDLNLARVRFFLVPRRRRWQQAFPQASPHHLLIDATQQQTRARYAHRCQTAGCNFAGLRSSGVSSGLWSETHF